MKIQGVPVQTRLIAFLDDASRVCCHGQFFPAENVDTLIEALRAAFYKRGVPACLYVDNGSIYTSKEIIQICARVGCLLAHTLRALCRGFSGSGQEPASRLAGDAERYPLCRSPAQASGQPQEGNFKAISTVRSSVVSALPREVHPRFSTASSRLKPRMRRAHTRKTPAVKARIELEGSGTGGVDRS